MEMKQETLEKIKRPMKRVKAAGGFYAKRLKHIDPDEPFFLPGGDDAE